MQHTASWGRCLLVHSMVRAGVETHCVMGQVSIGAFNGPGGSRDTLRHGAGVYWCIQWSGRE